jgi:hypothetical protein
MELYSCYGMFIFWSCSANLVPVMPRTTCLAKALLRKVCLLDQASELPVYYFEESRLCESPESDWQGTTPVGSPHVSTANSICIPEESVEIEPQTDHGIVIDSTLPQTESAARPASRSSELLIREPEGPAVVDGMYIAFLPAAVY